MSTLLKLIVIILMAAYSFNAYGNVVKVPVKKPKVQKEEYPKPKKEKKKKEIKIEYEFVESDKEILS